MESRRVYRGIEESALLGRRCEVVFPHDGLARNLRYNYRELCDRRERIYVRALTVASITANHKLNPSKGDGSVVSLINDGWNLIPYTHAASRKPSKGSSS